MPDRTRPIRKEICLNEQEFSVVRHKMNQLSTRNFGAYARKMLIDGYIIKVDYTEQKKLAASISRQNGYVEPDGTIRLYFTLEQAQTKLHRSRQSATRIFRELEYSGLIVRRKQGLGKPALITLNYPADAKLIQPKEDGAISHE